MRATNWKWFSCNSIPSINEIRQEATRLMNNVIDENLLFTGTGGLTVVVTKGKDYNGQKWIKMNLYFGISGDIHDGIEYGKRKLK